MITQIKLWIYLSVFGLTALTAGGFYLRKVYKEHGYRKGVEKQTESFADCIKKAKTYQEYQDCDKKEVKK